MTWQQKLDGFIAVQEYYTASNLLEFSILFPVSDGILTMHICLTVNEYVSYDKLSENFTVHMINCVNQFL